MTRGETVDESAGVAVADHDGRTPSTILCGTARRVTHTMISRVWTDRRRAYWRVHDPRLLDRFSHLGMVQVEYVAWSSELACQACGLGTATDHSETPSI